MLRSGALLSHDGKSSEWWVSCQWEIVNVRRDSKVQESKKSEAVSGSRRELCKKAIKLSSVAAAVGTAGYLTYKKPSVRSFFGASDAYAATTTVAGKFSLKGGSN